MYPIMQSDNMAAPFKDVLEIWHCRNLVSKIAVFRGKLGQAQFCEIKADYVSCYFQEEKF